MATASTAAFGATVTYDAGGGDEEWSTPTNWSTNSVPTSADDVIIANAGTGIVRIHVNPTVKSITVQNGAELRIESGFVLTVNNSSTVSNGGFLHLSGGDLAGNGALIVNGALAVNSSTLGGSGALTINSSGTMAIGSTVGVPVISRSITNAGTITFVNDSTNDTTFDGATLTNTGTIDIQNNYDINPGLGSPVINNNSGGLIVKSSGSGTSEINCTINNAAGATIETQTGDIELNGGGTVSGAYTIAPTEFIRLRAGTYTMSGSPTVSGGLLLIEGATLDAGAGVDVTLPNLTLHSGAITGPGAVRVSGDFTWRGGTIAGSGPRVLNSTSAPTFSCFAGDCIIDGAALQLQASATFSTVVNSLVLSNSASLTIAAGKTLSITFGDVLSGGGGASSIINNGTIWKTGISFSNSIDVPVTLSGTSTLDIDDGSVLFNADVTVAAGATLDIAATRTLQVAGGVFLFNSGTSPVLGAGTFKVSGGTLRVPTGITRTIPNLTLQGGTIDGAGNLHVSGTFSWLGGTIVGGGARVLDSSSTSTISCSAAPCNIDGATLQMNASGTFNATTNSLVFFNSASLVIASGKTLDIPTDGTIVGVGTITNNGTITKSGGAGIRSIGTVLHNNGSVIVTAGGLSLLGNGTHGGSFTTTAPGSMLFDGGAHTIAGGINGSGTMTVNGATVTLNATGNVGGFAMTGGTLGGSGTLTLANGGTWSSGTMSGSGTTAVAAGKTLTVSGFPSLNGRALDLGAGAMLDITGQMLDVPNAANVTGSGTVRVSGGTLRVATGVTQTIPNVTLQGSGVIDGAGALHVSGNFTWSGGTILGSGPRVLTGTSVPAISCSTGNCLLDGATLQLQASGTYSASTNALVLSNGASLILDAGRGLNVNNDGDFLSGGGTASSIVIGAFLIGTGYGSIWKTTTAGMSVIDVPVTVLGAINVDTGTLRVTADVNVGANTIIDYDPGSTIEVTGGMFLFNSSSVFLPLNGDFQVSGGTLRVPTGVTVTMPNLTLQGSGVVDGGGTLILSGTGSWLGGAMGSAAAPGGITRIDSGNGLNITPVVPSSLTQTRQLLNNGTVAYGSLGSNTLAMSGNSKITNNGALIFNDGTIDLSGSALIENYGSMTKVAGTGTTAIVPPVDNHSGGTISAPAGTIALSGGGIDAGAYDISSGATITLAGGTFTAAGTATVTGAGTLSIAGATFDAGAGADLTCPNVALSSGSITGAGAVRVSGNFTWSGGTIAGSGSRVLNSSSTSTISCSAGNCLLDGATLQLQEHGTYSASSNALVFSNGATLILDPGKILWVTNDGDFVSGGGAASSIVIGGFGPPGLNGCIQKITTTGTSIIGVPVTMSGSFFVDTGTMQVAADVTAGSGAILHRSVGATLELTGGVLLLSSSAVTFPANGDFKVSGGTLRVPTGVTVTILGLTLQGSGVIDGGGTLTLDGTSTWSGGTMSGSGTTVNPATKILNISAPVTLSRTLQNGGTLNVSGDITGTGTIDNGGTLNAVADLTLGVTLNNSGQVVTSNALSLAGGGTHAGSFSVTTPGSLSFPSGTHSMSGGSIGGTGTLAITGAAVTVGSPFTIGALSVTGGTATLDANGSTDAFTMTGGTLGGSGTLTLSNGGTWSGGSWSGSGTTVNPSTKTLSMSAPVTLSSRTIQNAGTLTVSGDVTGSGTIDNGGTLNAVADLTLGVTLNNSGQVVTSNALSLAGGGTHTGSFTVTTPGSLAFPSGTHSMSGGGSIAGTGTLTFSGATATVGVPVNASTLNVTAGTATLDANGSADTFTMTGGTLGGSGMLTLNNGGTWSGGVMSGSGTTINPATKTLSISAPVTLTSRTLQNAGTLTVSGDITGSGTIDNSGTLNAAANVVIGAALNNSGQVATSNALSLAGGGTHTGSFTVTTPGTLSFSSGTHTVSGGGSISGTGTLAFSGAAVTVSNPFTVGALSVTAGTATLDATSSAGAFTMNGGTLGGSGMLTLSNGGTWAGGTMNGAGTTINPATKTLDISAPVTLTTRTLQNDGTLSVNGNVAGSGTIANNGMLDVAGNSTIGAALNNGGQIATGQILSLGGNGTHTGTFTTTSTGVIDFSGGTQTISGTLAGTGTVRFSGAAATVSGTWTGMPIEVAGGSVALDTNGTIPALTLTGGTLAGSGDVTVSGPSTWSGGMLAGNGALTFGAGATVAMPGLSAVTLARPLLNQGTIDFTSASNGMLIDGVAVTNDGTFDIQSSQGIAATAGTPPFVNHGTLRRSSGSGVMLFAPPLSNSGQVQIESGTMQFGGTYAQSAGTTTILSGATLQTATLSLNGGSLTGNGTVVGTVANHAIVSPGASPGTLTIDGDYVQSPYATLEIQLGGTAPGTEYDRLLVSGSATLGGTLNVTTTNGFTVTPGNAFQIVTFGSLLSTFATMNGLTGSGAVLVAATGSTDLQLIANQIEANLAVSVSAPPSVAHGSTFAYTVSVFNGGNVDANGVSVTATLPPNVTFTGASPSICSGAPNLVCSIGALLNGSTAAIVISVTAGAAGAAPISVVATASEFDSNPANNTATASPIITAADVAVGLTGPLSTTAGTKAIYTVTVSNSGPETVTNIAVTAAASPGLTFSGNSGACAGSFPCNIGTLSSGQHATIYTAWDIDPSATGSVQLTVTATSPDDANASNDSASATTAIGNCPAIIIVAPTEMTSHATAAAAATPFDGATYSWSIVGGTIDSGDGTSVIAFTAGEPGTVNLSVNVTGGACTLGAAFDVTVKPPPACVGTATLTAPADGATVDAVVTFTWTVVPGASGYRLWLQEGDAPGRNLGTTLDTSRTRIIPPGSFRWYVETLFDGCASHESERLALTILPGQNCASHQAPQLSAPASETPATNAALAFSWNAVAEALEYELWLAPSGGVPTLIRTTSDTSCTAVVPPGRLEWYVRAVFGGCASTESAHRAFTYTPPPQCTTQRPLLIAPVEGERLTSPVSLFEWTSVPGATSYELYVDGVPAATTTSPNASDLPMPMGERHWLVRAHLGEGCGAIDSAESRLIVIPPSPGCALLGAPVLIAPAEISSGIAGRIQWSFVPGATLYVVEISGDPRFPRASTSSSTVTTRQLPFTFTNPGSAPVARYVRVHAVDTNCVQPVTGEFSPVAVLSVLPSAGGANGSQGVALLTDPSDVPYTLSIGAELAGQSFTATPTVPWLSVTPVSGIVPPGGQTLTAVAHTAGLAPGTNTGGVDVATAATTASGAVTAHATTPPKKLTITVNNIAGIVNGSKNTPPPDALIIPAVATVTNFTVRYDSDLRVTNTSAKAMKYDINFVPSGSAGISQAQKSTVDLKPGATMALNSVVRAWFTGKTTTGTLEIRPVTEIDTSTSSAPVGGLANRITFASSRAFSTTTDGGTYGQYVPAVLYANFIAKGSVLSLQHIGQSADFHTNLGLVEGSGEKVSLEVRVFDDDGNRQASFNVDLNGGEHAQLNSVLEEHHLALDDARIEVEVTAGLGKVTAYASVVDNVTKDAQVVPPVTLDHVEHTQWIVPGVTDLAGGSANAQTDVRIFNAGTEPADLTLEFYSMNGGPAATRTIQVAAGKVRQLDRVLEFFAHSGDAGALHITSAAPAQIVATARTYQQTGHGAFGQFIVAATPDEAVAAGSRPLQILQMEESSIYESNIGFAEVSGKPVTLEVAVFEPNSTTPKLTEVTLGPHQYVQLSSFLASVGLEGLYNARISVRVLSGEGRALAYGSLVDRQTSDPTYIPGQ